MPYFRRRMKRSRPMFKRRRFARKRSGAGYRPRMIRAMVAPSKGELKYCIHTTEINGGDMIFNDVVKTFSIATHTSLCMNAMAQGTTVSTRLGNTVYCQYLEMRGVLKNNDSTAGIPHVARIFVYIVK